MEVTDRVYVERGVHELLALLLSKVLFTVKKAQHALASNSV